MPGTYGAEVDNLIPELVRLANDVQFKDRPLSETLDGSKLFRVNIIILILKKRGTPKAREALVELAKNQFLKRRAEKALNEINLISEK